jgi:hypothetical protein
MLDHYHFAIYPKVVRRFVTVEMLKRRRSGRRRKEKTLFVGMLLLWRLSQSFVS